MVLGGAALGISSRFYPFLGVSARDDVLERRILAALFGIVGAQLGSMCCFAGGNIGKGPGVAVVVLSAGAALGAWFVLWYFAEILSGRVISERITVEPDTGAGLSLAALLIANDIILGTATAGDWIPESFLHYFMLSASPALGLSALAGFVERIFPAHSLVRHSILTGLACLAVAIVWMVRWGFAQ